MKPETQDCLIVGNRRKTNLGDILVKAKISTPKPAQYGEPPDKCKKKQCKICPLIIRNNHCTSFHTRRQYRTPQHSTCKNNNLVYLLDCQYCGLQYVGETKRRVHDRLSEHVRDTKNKKNTPVAKHFNLPYHNYQHIRIQALEYIIQNRHKESTTTFRRGRETYWIHQLKTLDPWGINKMG